MSSVPKVLVAIANGSEEIEAVTIIDTLRRAGCEVVVASVEADKTVTMSRKTIITADALIGDVSTDSFELIALPGGILGATNLLNNATLQGLITAQHARNGLLGAICAAPWIVFDGMEITKDVEATCHPAFKDKLKHSKYVDKRVVNSGNVITSQGPGTALEFAIELVHALLGEEKAKQVKEPMIAHF